MTQTVPFNFAGWEDGKTFSDLQALQLVFVRGLIEMTPYHFGRLDPESSIIVDQLYDMNRFDILTVDSQPFETDVGPDKVITLPYVFLFCPNEKVDGLIKGLSGRNDILINVWRLSTGEAFYVLPGGGDKYYWDMAVVAGQYMPEMNLDIDSSEEWTTILKETFGANFTGLVTNNLSYVQIYSNKLSNDIFDDLVKIAKSLL